ncbi:hypothetical protein CVT24_011446 [Panaeolus cyanescens]|uniref:Uncharacterized protein n=1 Tax=Panaeolus cyanescens TaxID=181874 RepID=A0A409VGD1_9AGAR|nr:hypothetical protein CVT24_011446 [Panaeolus cyanescens]
MPQNHSKRPILSPSPLLSSPFPPFERLGSPIHLHSEPIASTSLYRPTKSVSRRRRSPRRALHAFDDLPWRSTLDESPQFINPSDIADLSLISNSGPIRTRKSSLRSTPLSSPPPTSPITPCDTSYLSRFLTPPPRIIPSRVLFKNLMPVSCDSDSSLPCITTF